MSLNSIRELLISSRNQLVSSVNTMIQTYWQIGKLFVEDEQNGNIRAKYGKKY